VHHPGARILIQESDLALQISRKHQVVVGQHHAVPASTELQAAREIAEEADVLGQSLVSDPGVVQRTDVVARVVAGGVVRDDDLEVLQRLIPHAVETRGEALPTVVRRDAHRYYRFCAHLARPSISNGSR
jgi:hypothetical protein